MVTSSHLRFGSYTYMSLHSCIRSPALSPAHWFLNAEVCECVFTEHTASIQISCQEPTLPCQSLGMNWGMEKGKTHVFGLGMEEWELGNGEGENLRSQINYTEWGTGNGGMGMREWEYLFGSETFHVSGLEEVVQIV